MSTPNERLLAASRKGELEAVQQCLDHGASTLTRGVMEMTALHYASRGGKGDIVLLLLDNAADINAQDSKGETPLHKAASSGHHDVVKTLLSRGAKRIVNKDSKYPEDLAKDRNIIATIKSSQDRGHNALDSYRASGYLSINNNQNGNNNNNNNNNNIITTNNTPTIPDNNYNYSNKYTLNSSANLFSPSPSISSFAENNLTKFQTPSSSFSTPSTFPYSSFSPSPSVAYLSPTFNSLSFTTPLSANTLPYGSNNSGGTLKRSEEELLGQQLVASADRGDLISLKRLLNLKVSPDSTREGLTALHCAAKRGHVEICEELLLAKASINSTDKTFCTPLHHASVAGQYKIINLLISAGADVKAINDQRDTALHLAVKSGNSTAVEALIKFNADVAATNKDGLRADEILSTNTELNQLFQRLEEQRKSSFKNKLASAIKDNNLEAFSSLLKDWGSTTLNGVFVALPLPVVQAWSALSKDLHDNSTFPPIATNLTPHLASATKGQYMTLLQIPTESRDAKLLKLLGTIRFEDDEQVVLKELLDIIEESTATPLQMVVSAIAFNKAFDKAANLSRMQQLFGIQAGGFATAYLACPQKWRENIGGKLLEAAVAIEQKHRNSLHNTIIENFQNIKPQSDATQGATDTQANTEWETMKKNSALKSVAIDKLMEMKGLAPVKLEFLSVYNSVSIDKRRGTDFQNKRYNVRLEGNPGTGKTTVARLYAELLKELGVIKAATMEETTGAELVDGGVDALKKKLDKIYKGGGGLLFVDEAYTLNPQDTFSNGRKILDYLLPEMESKVGQLVVAFAGYVKPMEKLFEYNEGLPSRFPVTLKFSDFSDAQLLEIFTSLMKTKAAASNIFSFVNNDPKYARIAARRLGRLRDAESSSFGNARSVVNLFEQTLKRQAVRIRATERAEGRQMSIAELHELHRDDILGPAPPSSLEQSSQAYKKLMAMIGLQEVKDSVHSLFDLVRLNLQLEEEEKEPRNVTLNRLFLGNPGTGKTTVAALYAQILRDVGLLSKGDIVSKTASDFIGSVLGESQDKTNRIIKSAEGSVLVIDEAYGLFPGTNPGDPYKESAINAIVEKIQNVPGDDRCVVMLGYEEQMREMMTKCNPGLQRRFQLDNAFHFADYSDDDLMDILSKRIREEKLIASLSVKLVAIKLLAIERNKPHFGNAGAVNNLLSRATMRMSTRTAASPSNVLLEEDFNADHNTEPESEASLFEGLVGCDNIIKVMKEYSSTIKYAQSKGKDLIADGKFELNFQLVGPPGTGKTTVARRLGRMFKSLGILQSDSVVSHSASSFSTGFVGQAGTRARDIVKSAIGKVLFIDEAYRLTSDQFLLQALDELVQLLTEKDIQGKLVVVLAGYENDMQRLMATNEGLRSRFSRRLVFQKFNVEDSCAVMKTLMSANGLKMNENAELTLPTLMHRLVEQPSFASGRDVSNWTTRVETKLACRLFSSEYSDKSDLVSVGDLKESLDELLDTMAVPSVQEREPAIDLPMMYASSNAPPPQKFTVSTAIKENFANEKSPNQQLDLQEEDQSNGPISQEQLDYLDSSSNSAGIMWDLMSVGDLRANPRFMEALVQQMRGRAAAEELLRQLELERERLKALLLEQEEAERKERERIEQEKLAARQAADAAARKKAEDEARRKEEALERERRAQEKLRSMGVCVAGYRWIKMHGGYRCAGGLHFVSDHMLGL